MNFNEFKLAIEIQFDAMKVSHMYRAELSKDDLWDTYLSSFPEGSDPIFRERTVHDCQCCKQFIRRIGGAFAFTDGGKERISVWDGAAADESLDANYRVVAEAMSLLVRSATIRGPFLHYETNVGIDKNYGEGPDGKTETWEHFHVKLPKAHVRPGDMIPTTISKIVSGKQVFERALKEITLDACDTVLELIDQKSLYRGEENRGMVRVFRAHVLEYQSYSTDDLREFYCWDCANSLSGGVIGIRNTSIGTLLTDLSEGKGLDQAVGSFEAMVAPANYKRPTALITKTMIKKAQETVEELGFVEALGRRHATIEDITINNVLFANRDARGDMAGDGVFDQLTAEVGAVNTQKLSKVEELDIEDFINDVLPKIDSIELLVENKHTGNLMSLIAPADADANNMLKWDNNFSWTYNGEIADSMKERVKSQGGNVEGIMRFSIQWNDGPDWNINDFDAHCIEPNGNLISFRTKAPHVHPSTGVLDVDIINPLNGVAAVENITWTTEQRMQEGTYEFLVHNYSGRRSNEGFSAEFEYNGEIRTYEYNKPLRGGEKVGVLKGRFERHQGLTIAKELSSSVSSKEVWGVPTMQYQPVSMVMNSPNHWDGHHTGNKHYFFMLEGCKQPGRVRGFYNEFLTDKLLEHRKVFEVLGSKMRVEEAEAQLSGLGFSSTQRNHVYCRVNGKFTRTLKITF